METPTQSEAEIVSAPYDPGGFAIAQVEGGPTVYIHPGICEKMDITSLDMHMMVDVWHVDAPGHSHRRAVRVVMQEEDDREAGPVFLGDKAAALLRRAQTMHRQLGELCEEIASAIPAPEAEPEAEAAP